MTELISMILIVSVFLIVISAIHHYVRHFIIPAMAIMMVLGAVSVFLPIPDFSFEEFYDFVEEDMSEVILLVIIPILIFESGRKVKLENIKHESGHIGFFAIVGVIITIFLIGFSIGFIFEIPLIHALLFGSILAATDPVAVGAVFKKFPIPERLNTLIEGESLFNDATGVISFNVIKTIIFAGVAFSFLDTTLSFFWSMIGAMLFGIGIGWATGKILNKWDGDEHIDFTMSIAIAVGGYAIAEHFLHVSGVVTTLFIALFILRTHKEKMREVRVLFGKYWDYLGFVANSILFFLIGIPLFVTHTDYSLWLALAIPIIVLIISRGIVVYGGNVFLRLFRIKVPIAWQHVLTLGGIRGGISVALVLSLPASYEYKELFVTLIVYLIAINLVLNPVLLTRYMKRAKLE